MPLEAGLGVNGRIRNKYRNKEPKWTVEMVRQISGGLMQPTDFWVLQKSGSAVGDQLLPGLCCPIRRLPFLTCTPFTLLVKSIYA